MKIIKALKQLIDDRKKRKKWLETFNKQLKARMPSIAKEHDFEVIKAVKSGGKYLIVNGVPGYGAKYKVQDHKVVKSGTVIDLDFLRNIYEEKGIDWKNESVEGIYDLLGVEL